MRRTLTSLLAAAVILFPASAAFAQLDSAKEGPIVYGHHHLNTANLAAQKKFFVDTLGGTAITIGTNNTEIIKFPNVLIFFRTNQAPTGGTRGTTVNHIGFGVPNLRQAIDKIKANGYQDDHEDRSGAGSQGHRRHRRAGTTRRHLDRVRARTGGRQGGTARGTRSRRFPSR